MKPLMCCLLCLNSSNVSLQLSCYIIVILTIMDLTLCTFGFSLSLQIEPIHVDFGRFNFQTGEMNICHTYPPSFTIVIDGHRAIQESFATFEFKGTLPTRLVYEIPLTYESRHHPLERSKCTRQVHNHLDMSRCV